MGNCNIGIYGLGVMGRNLALNLENHGNCVSVFNRKAAREKSLVPDFLSEEGNDRNFYGAESVPDFILSLEKPGKYYS